MQIVNQPRPQYHQNFRPAVHVTPTAGAPVQFGSDLITIGQGLIMGALKPANENDKGKSGGGTSWKGFFQRNLIFTTLLTVGLANSDAVYREAVFGFNSYYGQALETVPGYDPNEPLTPVVPPPVTPGPGAPGPVIPGPIPPVANPPVNPPTNPPVVLPAKPTVNQMIRMARESRIVFTTAYIYEMAKAGLVKEVHTPYTDKPAAPGVVPWNAILIDGSSVKAEMDADTRQKLLTELRIPVRHPITGFNIGWIEASLLAAVIVNGLSSLTSDMRDKISHLLKGQKIKSAGPSPEEKKLMELYDTGRVLVATVLNVDPSPITEDMVQEHMGQLSLSRELKPLSHADLKNRLVVLLAGPAVEKKLNKETLSVGSSGSLEEASKVSGLMISRLGMSEMNGLFIPKELIKEDDKVKAQEEVKKLFEWAEKRAREIVDQYGERLEPLREALKELKILSREEVLAILEGKNAKDIKKQRGFLFRMKQSMTPKVVTAKEPAK